MLYDKKRIKRKRKIRIWFFILVVFVILWFIYFENVSGPYQRNLVENRAKVIAEQCVTDGVNKVLNAGNYTYENFAKHNYGTDNKIQSISIDSVTVNTFKTEISNAILEQLSENQYVQFKAPLGAFTGLTLLSDHGPQITLNFRLSGSSTVNLESTFESAGINQTLHHIILVVDATVVSTAPGNTKQYDFTTNFEIAQTVIVGEVTNFYAGTLGNFK